MSITFRRAVRENVGLILGIAGSSGSGKTYSALRLASGMAGGRPFAVLDTEAGRASHYSDRFAFDVADLRPPFRPSVYAEAIREADKAGYPVIVVDSFSHEHAGEGGLLDWHEEELDRLAGTDYKRRESCKMAAWIKPKTDHKRMVSQLLQVRAHLILCFRAEQKVEMVRGANGHMEIQPKKIASGFSDWIPICERNILYELTASFLLTPEQPGVPKPIKLEAQHREIISLTLPLCEAAGKRLAEWASGAAKPLQEAAQYLAGTPEPVAVEVTSTQPSPFIWRCGKEHKGKPIDEIPLDYLEWFAKNGKLDDHRQAAQAAVDWANSQASLGMDEQG